MGHRCHLADIVYMTIKVVIFTNLVVTCGLAFTQEWPETWSHSHEWAVRLHQRGDDNQTFATLAEELARTFNLINLGGVGPLEDVYHFMPRHLCDPLHSTGSECWAQRKKRTAPDVLLHARISAHKHVFYVEQQRPFRRYRRSPFPTSLELQENLHNWKDNFLFVDPLYHDQWHLHNEGSDINAGPVWAKGIAGSGVVLTVIDDGLEHYHPDLQDNYDPEASYDLNDDDPDPRPRYSPSNINKHGTRCAGEIAAVANNTHCGVGVAYKAKVGGIRLIDGDVTDTMEAKALGLNSQHIAIYSSSWGPEDDGKTVEGPGPLAQAAIIHGIEKGRGGLGSIYVFAGGNGKFKDNCNCDGYTNSIYTISIGAIDKNNNWPWYSEPCSATIAVTYSSGAHSQVDGIRTVDLRLKCTAAHTGTSAAAPLAAGIFALVLQARSQTTWRDLQHLIITTARIVSPQDTSWASNGVGRKISHKFGYGAIDSSSLVNASQLWDTVSPHKRFTSELAMVNQELDDGACLYSTIYIKQGSGHVNFLEHVTANVTIRHDHRGDLEIYLISPCGTRSQLLTTRYSDNDKTQGFKDWTFMTVFAWGENPTGEWQLEVKDTKMEGTVGKFYQWQLTMWGSELSCDPPNCLKNGTSTVCSIDHRIVPCTVRPENTTYTPTAPSNNTEKPSSIPYSSENKRTKTTAIIVSVIVVVVVSTVGLVVVTRMHLISWIIKALDSREDHHFFHPLPHSESHHEMNLLNENSVHDDHTTTPDVRGITVLG